MIEVTLLNYADHNFRSAQRLNSRAGREVAGFDRVLSYGPGDIDARFRDANRATLSAPKGGGFWLWKPYFINRALAELPDGEWLFYCDSGSYFIESVRPAIEYFASLGENIFCFEDQHAEYKMTKRAVFERLGVEEGEIMATKQRLGGFLLFRASDNSRAFVRRWLQLAQESELINDELAGGGEGERPDFLAHRHDQSLLSVLSKLSGITAYRDPSQFGNRVSHLYHNSPYGQLIQLTRQRDIPFPKRLKRWLAANFGRLGSRIS